MAIYHYSTNVHSRGKGHSAVAAAAYRSAQVLLDERIGEKYDWRQYRKSHGQTLAAEIVLPKGTPESYRDRGFLWNAVESAEKTKAGDYKKTAAVAREVEASLPHEMNDRQRVELARGYAAYLVKRYGAAVDMAIHAPHTEGDQRNHHVHFLMSTRQLGRDGFGGKTELELDGKAKKARGFATGKKQIKEMRESWASHVNREMARSGFSERIDHRSLEDQGVKRAPTRHMGPDATAMKRKEKETRIGQENERIEAWNRERADLEWQESIINAAIEDEEKRVKEEREKAREEARARLREARSRELAAKRERIDEAIRRRLAGVSAKIRRLGSFADHLDAQREAEAKAQAEAERKEQIFGQQRRNIEETLKHRPPADKQERKRLKDHLRDEDKGRSQTPEPPSPTPPERPKSARDMLNQFDRAADLGTDSKPPSPARSKDSARSMLDRFDKAAAPPANDNAKNQDRQSHHDRDRGKDDDWDIGR